MTVLLRTSHDLPPTPTYSQWLTIGNTAHSLTPEGKVPGLSAELEDAFDTIAKTWLSLGRELGTEPSAGLAHTPACSANASDFGLMMTWSRIVEKKAGAEETVLVVCDDPWMFRHLSSLQGVNAGTPPGLWCLRLKLAARGFAARLKNAVILARDSIRLRHQRRLATSSSAVLLVYGHPKSTAEGTDGYFGGLMKESTDLCRMLHVDCAAARVRELEGGGRTLSLRAWGKLSDALLLPFARWKPLPRHLIGEWGWLVRRAAALEGGTGQGATIAWQQKCQHRWLTDTRPRILVWPWENHSWEREFVRTARALGIRTIGYQHSVIGRQMLNCAAGSNPDGLASLPDQILCTGDSTRRQLLEWGVPDERLKIGGALRFFKPPSINPDPEGPVYLALPFDPETAGQMIAAAHALTDKGFRFLVKDHPMTPFLFSPTPAIERTDKPFFEHPGLRALVYAATTVGLESALTGLPTIRFRPEGRIAIDILPKGVRLPVTDAAGLAQAINQASIPALDRSDIFAPVPKDLWQRTLAND
ncbi:MAG: hypothetical protein HQ494_06945 [Rhodospirillales bacterium]|nr:hypothetical protein [Rhodospirillales bacterium]